MILKIKIKFSKESGKKTKILNLLYLLTTIQKYLHQNKEESKKTYNGLGPKKFLKLYLSTYKQELQLNVEATIKKS